MLHELDIIDFETGVDIMDIGQDDLLDLDVVEAAANKSEPRGVFSGLYPHSQQTSQHEAHHDFHRDVLGNVPFQLMDSEAKGDHGVFDEFRIDLPDVLETKPKRQYKKRGPKSPRTPKAGKTTKLGRKRKSEELHVSSPKPKKMLKSFMSDSNIAVMPKRSLKKSQSDMGALAVAPSKSGSKRLMGLKSFGSDDSKGARQTSTFRGVSCCGKDRKWQARIRDANRVRYLGRYHTEVEAALEYDKVAREIKGSKAPTNFLPLSHEVTEAVKQSFAEHGYIIEKYQHLVVRNKAKSPPTSPRVAAVAAEKKSVVPGGDFPESPMAKIHSVNAAPCLNLSKLQAKPVSLMTQQASSKLHPVVTKKGRALQLE
mmetsp:Transcript_48164/g.105034  ORF Transcript_48164/g.105034 Transcript_48164/m.105034 type:complete len:369 (+) Transcript_48164:206-1312(+)